MKVLVSLLILFGAFQVSAAECVDAQGQDILDQPEVFQQLIQQQDSCYEAAELARACAWGSSLDRSTAGIAYVKCRDSFESRNPRASDLKLLEKMSNRCDESYSNRSGTIYISFNAYCQLAALEWLNTLTSEE